MPQRPRPRSSAWALIPEGADLDAARRAAAACRACPLWEGATQVVFGEGPADAEVMLVGEGPGEVEDRTGRPFVGPAGQLLDQALSEAGLARDRIYVTNMVKHFKWVPQGSRRAPKKPSAEEVHACRPWLETELRLVRPRVLVFLGATAAQAMLGADFRVSRQRGQRIEGSPLAPFVLATVHPSSILRTPDEPSRRHAYKSFVADLAVAAEAAGHG